MIITDRFVYIHQPKTGGSFVTAALERVHDIEGLGKGEYQTPFGQFIYRRKHIRCRRIPDQHRSKPVLATVRNPYDLYVSQYEFGWWKKDRYLKEYRTLPGFDERFPNFPDIDFSDYVALANNAWCQQDGGGARSVGSLTRDFVRFYFPEPRETLRSFSDEYITSGKYKADMYDVHFIHTCSLNAELHEFLLACGYPPQNIAFILELDKVHPEPPPEGRTRPVSRSWYSYYTAHLKTFVRQKERHLFTMFPEFDC
jgi:hypothetical protein